MSTVTIKNVTDYLEGIAPRSLQEDYDNSGLITGSPHQLVTGILVTLDCTEQVIEEALAHNCNLIVAHHPILFKGVRRLTGQHYVERVLIKAIQSGIGIYAIHTNLDNVYNGVNKIIADKIGIANRFILLPKKNTLSQLVTFIPKANSETVINALFAAGAGQIGNYKNCSFKLEGEGSFMPTEQANPYSGKVGMQESANEVRVELILPAHKEGDVIEALRKSHPYEEVAYYLTRLENSNQEVGAGLIGDLKEPVDAIRFLKELKDKMKLNMIRHTHLLEKPIKKVAVCGGSGSFLLSTAIAKGADILITADFKYHEFFDSDGKIIIADIGHYESEQFTKELLHEFLKEKFHTFAIIFSKIVTNPISYL
jgi:dinuclear metal center YbgI/SA1388 family protein